MADDYHATSTACTYSFCVLHSKVHTQKNACLKQKRALSAEMLKRSMYVALLKGYYYAEKIIISVIEAIWVIWVFEVSAKSNL